MKTRESQVKRTAMVAEMSDEHLANLAATVVYIMFSRRAVVALADAVRAQRQRTDGG